MSETTEGQQDAGAEQIMDAASFSANGVSVVGIASETISNFVEFDPDMPELVVSAKNLGAEERAAVRVAMAQAAEELARLGGAGLTREQNGSASSAGLNSATRARRNWILASGQMRGGFAERGGQGWNSFAG